MAAFLERSLCAWGDRFADLPQTALAAVMIAAALSLADIGLLVGISERRSSLALSPVATADQLGTGRRGLERRDVTAAYSCSLRFMRGERRRRG